MYGFDSCHFDALRGAWAMFSDVVLANRLMSLHQRVRRWNYRRKGKLSHLLWEFQREPG